MRETATERDPETAVSEANFQTEVTLGEVEIQIGRETTPLDRVEETTISDGNPSSRVVNAGQSDGYRHVKVVKGRESAIVQNGS